MERFDILRLRKTFMDSEQEALSNDFIAENLIVLRNPPVTRLVMSLDKDTYILPEMRMMVFTRGHASPQVNMLPRRYEAGQLVFLAANSMVRAADYSADLQGFGLSLTEELMALTFATGLPKAFDGHVRDFSLPLTPDEMHTLNSMHAVLDSMTRQPHVPPQTIVHLVAALLWQADSLWGKHESRQTSALSREQRLFADFVKLVSLHAAEQHGIDFYADRLCLSPRYMSAIVKRVSGKAAKQWIDDAIVTRIKVALRHSDKTVSQIADETCMPGVSFLCKYFKRMTGLTPTEYRNAYPSRT